MFSFLNKLKLRGKLLALVLPLVIVPIFVVAGAIGLIANQQAYLGITKTSKDDLQHLSAFSIDLLDSHYQQFQVYKQDKAKNLNNELATLTALSYNLVTAEQNQYAQGKIDLETAKREARQALKKINVGESGYIYAMTSRGDLQVHIAREGENVFNERDENGRYFIREMCAAARASKPGETLYTTYPWRNAVLGDTKPRTKVVAYKYFREWDWIIASGSYPDEVVGDAAFESQAFEKLKDSIRAKKVGTTGYIYCMDSKGTFTVHPDSEGKNRINAKDVDGNDFIREMCTNKSGWIRYPWKNSTDAKPRMKIVRYEYFEPWDWIVAVGSYEDEFYQEANKIKSHILFIMALLILVVGAAAISLVIRASAVITNPITDMMSVIKQIKRGNLDERMTVNGEDELAELGSAFNRMTEIIQRNKDIESNLAQQGKMASLGVLSSGVAHEINNPLGAILHNVQNIRRRLSPDLPKNLEQAEQIGIELDTVNEYLKAREVPQLLDGIQQAGARAAKIVTHMLSFSRRSTWQMAPCDLPALIDQAVEIAGNDFDLAIGFDFKGQAIIRQFDPALGPVPGTANELEQVLLNLLKNAAQAIHQREDDREPGRIILRTKLNPPWAEIQVEDNGIGMSESVRKRTFEPFFTTKEIGQGTGLGLSVSYFIITNNHKGQMEVQSTPGQGTCFTLRLPLASTPLVSQEFNQLSR